jgi:EAL domain-containing protein (putative c-di-GMP-specific phosphodiesterase class I)
VQGFYFAEPMPAEELQEFMRSSVEMAVT